MFAAIYGRYVRSITKRVQDKLADSSQVAEERFSNMRTVRAFAQEYKEVERYNNTIEDVYQLSKKEAIARAVFFGFVSILFSVGIILFNCMYVFIAPIVATLLIKYFSAWCNKCRKRCNL